MAKYRVYMQNTVNHYLDVEADTETEAEDEANREGLPSLMLLDHTYPDEGEWEVTAIEEVDDA